MTAATVRIELEQIGRQAITVLYASINGEIDSQASFWTTRDAAFWPSIGQTDPSVQVEHIPTENFYVGHVPSLINAPVAKYPNCAAYGLSATPTPSTDDEGEIYDIKLAVEVMCKSHKDEQEVNSRCQRTVEAAHSVLAADAPRRFGGYATAPAYQTPTVTIGDVFIRREERSRGDRWFWQGGRLEYRLERFIQY